MSTIPLSPSAGITSSLASNQDFSMTLGSILGLRSPSQTQVSAIFTNLEPFIPHLDSAEVERLEKMLKKLFGGFPHELLSEQASLTTQLGTWHLQNRDPVKAMHYYAYALKREPTEERHRLTSEVFIQWVLLGNTYKERLEAAYGEGDVALFDQLVDSIHDMQRFCYNDQDFHAVRKVANDVLVDDPRANRMELFTECAEKLHALVPQPLTAVSVTITYAQALQTYRQHCTLDHYKAFFKCLLDDALILLGRPPCPFDLRAMGSLARNEPGPFSDLEYFILIQDAKHGSYFQSLAQLIELQFLSFGETDFPLLHISEGMHVDPGANPGRHLDLIGTPQEMAARTTPNNNEELRLTLFQSVSLLETPPDLVTEFHKALDPEEIRQKALIACRSLKEHYETEWTVLPAQLQEYNLKEQFILPLNVLLGLLTLYHGSWEDKFTPSANALIKTTLGTLHKIRVRLHTQYQEHKDTVVPAKLELAERKTLHKAYWLLIRPLYECFDRLFETTVLDLPEEAFEAMMREMLDSPPMDLVTSFVAHLVECGAPVEQHFRTLLGQPELRRVYLETLESFSVNVTSLAQIPSRDGWSYAQIQDARYVEQALLHFTTETPSQVKVQIPGIGQRYLQPKVAREIIDGHGNIKKLVKDCFHNVASISTGPFSLHFKQKPNNPLLEYAIHALSYRVVGKSTPPVQLARFEVNGRAYPVLVSQTIPGATLKSTPDARIDRASHTKMLLMSILTRPGDGRPSNYIVDEREGVYCIDNDVSFVEPVVKSRLSQQVKFSSVLFCMDDSLLDEEALRDFVQLNPDAILNSWMEEVIQKEQEYTALFTEVERRKLYEEDRENRFTPSLLFKEGAIGTLYLQFHHLQHAIIESKHQLNATDLLKELITLGKDGGKNLVGAFVSKQYQTAFSSNTPEKCLEKALSKSQAKSMTSKEAMGAIFGKVPTVEEIESKQTYSLAKAREELYALVLDQFLEGSSLISRSGETVLQTPFEKIEPPRHGLILEALHALLRMEKFQNPSVVALTHCHALTTPKLLDPFLSEKLRILDLRYCPRLPSSMIKLVAKRCPNLEKLYLSGSGIDALIAQPRVGGAKALEMPSLRILHISRCERLKIIKLEVPFLTLFKGKENPLLREADLEAVISIIDGSPCEPRAPQWTSVDQGLLKKILPLFPSTVVRENPYIYRNLCARLKESEIRDVFASQNATLTELDLQANKIGVEGAKALAQALSQNTSLTQLNLGYNSIEDAGAKALAQALSQNTTLTQLNLTLNSIEDAGAKALAQALSQNTTLTQLDLSNNSIGVAGAKALAQALSQNASLTQLNLRSNSIGVEGAQALAQALSQNTTLTQLNLTFNSIRVEGAKALAKALFQNSTLTQLDLDGNSIRVEGAKALAKALSQNTTLTQLVLSENSIGNEGAKALAQALSQNATLTKLNLRWNSMGDEGAKALAQALSQNAKLTKLDLSDNSIGDEGAKALAQALSQNTSLTQLSLSDKSIGAKLSRSIQAALERNKARLDQITQASVASAENSQTPTELTDGDAN